MDEYVNLMDDYVMRLLVFLKCWKVKCSKLAAAMRGTGSRTSYDGVCSQSTLCGSELD